MFKWKCFSHTLTICSVLYTIHDVATVSHSSADRKRKEFVDLSWLRLVYIALFSWGSISGILCSPWPVHERLKRRRQFAIPVKPSFVLCVIRDSLKKKTPLLHSHFSLKLKSISRTCFEVKGVIFYLKTDAISSCLNSKIILKFVNIHFVYFNRNKRDCI